MATKNESLNSVVKENNNDNNKPEEEKTLLDEEICKYCHRKSILSL